MLAIFSDRFWGLGSFDFGVVSFLTDLVGLRLDLPDCGENSGPNRCEICCPLLSGQIEAPRTSVSCSNGLGGIQAAVCSASAGAGRAALLFSAGRHTGRVMARNMHRCEYLRQNARGSRHCCSKPYSRASRPLLTSCARCAQRLPLKVGLLTTLRAPPAPSPWPRRGHRASDRSSKTCSWHPRGAANGIEWLSAGKRDWCARSEKVRRVMERRVMECSGPDMCCVMGTCLRRKKIWHEHAHIFETHVQERHLKQRYPRLCRASPFFVQARSVLRVVIGRYRLRRLSAHRVAPWRPHAIRIEGARTRAPNTKRCAPPTPAPGSPFR